MAGPVSHNQMIRDGLVDFTHISRLCFFATPVSVVFMVDTSKYIEAGHHLVAW